MLLHRMVVDTERGRTGLPQCRVRVGVDSYNLKKVLNLTCLLTNLTTSRMFYHPRTKLSGTWRIFRDDIAINKSAKRCRIQVLLPWESSMVQAPADRSDLIQRSRYRKNLSERGRLRTMVLSAWSFVLDARYYREEQHSGISENLSKKI
jgi:hypothetical protein